MTREQMPAADGGGSWHGQLTHTLQPGQTLRFDSVLYYRDGGQVRTLTGPGLTLTPASLTTASGTLTGSCDLNGMLHYDLKLSGITNPAVAGSALRIDGIRLELQPVSGPAVSLQAGTRTLNGGTATLSLTDTADLSALPGGSYRLSAELRGTWLLDGKPLQNVPTRLRLEARDPILLADTYQVAMPTVGHKYEFQAEPVGLGLMDSSGQIVYRNGPIRARPGQRVYIKMRVRGEAEVPTELGELTLRASVPITMDPAPVQLVHRREQVSREYTGWLTMPERDVTDIALQELAAELYVYVHVHEQLMEPTPDGFVPGTRLYFRSPPVISGTHVVTEQGMVYAKNGTQLEITAQVGVAVSNQVIFADLAAMAPEFAGISFDSYRIGNYADSGTDGTDTVRFRLTVDESTGIPYRDLVVIVGASII